MKTKDEYKSLGTKSSKFRKKVFKIGNESVNPLISTSLCSASRYLSSSQCFTPELLSREGHSSSLFLFMYF